MIYRFVWKLSLFLAPLVLIAFAVLAISWISGEARPLRQIAAKQYADRAVRLYLIGSRERIFEFRYASILTRQPEILIIGSSRTYYFRDYFFNRKPDAFYNSGLPGTTIYEINAMLHKVAAEGHLPPIILIGLDYPNYNADGDIFDDRRIVPSETTAFDQFISGTKRTIIHTIQHPEVLAGLLDAKQMRLHYGINAFSDQVEEYYDGDGSRVLNNLSAEKTERDVQRQLEILNNGGRLYQPGKTVDYGAVNELEQFLILAQQHDSIVIGFFPPYHNRILEVLQNRGDHTYIPDTWDAVAALFERYGYDLYDFSSVETVDGQDSEMYDGSHPGELLSLKIYLSILRDQSDLLSAYSDLQYLENLVASATDPFHMELESRDLQVRMP